MPSNPFPHEVKAMIRENSIFGTLHGMQTFAQQLIAHSPREGTTDVQYNRPSLLPHCRLVLDTSRNYTSIASLYRTIDTMVKNKLDIYHYHIADSPLLDDNVRKIHEIDQLVQKDHRVAAGSSGDRDLDYVFGDRLGSWIVDRSLIDYYKGWQKIHSFDPILELNIPHVERG
ncbi:hypothetical protein BGZ65_008212 [Modicella reniformis]|uniref:beta-N-acetylhexosaminidase n=1 Tax=Modicella reniformis TaxID=1440133 RepID=A0A9P6J7X2_9FUNG|nr:hypothetical protein BGZ65_008212 [Modicella reniformis]